MELTRKNYSFKTQTLWAFVATVGAVALPQIFHVLGAVSGLGTALGETFLPMHLPVMLVGFITGPWAGFMAGIASPVISFLLTGMPTAALLPFMVVELSMYGLFSGVFVGVKMPNFTKVITVQVLGRVCRAAAILLAVYAFGYDKIAPAIIYKSVLTGIFGILLQIVLIPLVLYRVSGGKKNA